MSLNLHLPHAGAVLRIHQPFESRNRVAALRHLRRRLDEAGFTVGVPQLIDGRELVQWEGRLAELESYVSHVKPAPTWESYLWMYEAMGRLHRALRRLATRQLPRPTIATYGPPGTLRRWMPVTRRAVEHDPRARALAVRVQELVRQLARLWPPADRLQVHVVHGDIRLGNVARDARGTAAHLDFGFAANRPRIHELGYSLSWVILRPDASGTGEDFAWERLPELIRAYEHAAGDRLSVVERSGLAAYVAAVPLYLAAISGFTPDPAAHLIENEPFIRIADWILMHSERLVSA